LNLTDLSPSSFARGLGEKMLYDDEEGEETAVEF